MSNYLKIYIGSPENKIWLDYLYLDLVVSGKEFQLWSSNEPIKDCAGDDFLEYLTEAFNLASLVATKLRLRVSIDSEQILLEAQDFSERTERLSKRMLREFKLQKEAV